MEYYIFYCRYVAGYLYGPTEIVILTNPEFVRLSRKPVRNIHDL